MNDRDQKEIEYLLKRELEELLMDLEDERVDLLVKQTLRERYKVLFNILKRIATSEECLRYILKPSKYY